MLTHSAKLLGKIKYMLIIVFVQQRETFEFIESIPIMYIIAYVCADVDVR